MIGLLEDEFELFACDTPGFGASPPLTGGRESSIPACTEAFVRFFAELGLECPHVAGSSMGGAISLELARRGCVSSVTAFAPAGFWTARERRYTQLSLGGLAALPRPLQAALTVAVRSSAARRLLLAQLFGAPQRLDPGEAQATLRDAFEAPGLKGALRAFSDYTFDRGGALAATPLTVAWGNRDYLLPYGRQAPRARRALPHGHHVTLGAGHVPFSDDPAACAAVVRGTVARAG